MKQFLSGIHDARDGGPAARPEGQQGSTGCCGWGSRWVGHGHRFAAGQGRRRPASPHPTGTRGRFRPGVKHNPALLSRFSPAAGLPRRGGPRAPPAALFIRFDSRNDAPSPRGMPKGRQKGCRGSCRRCRRFSRISLGAFYRSSHSTRASASSSRHVLRPVRVDGLLIGARGRAPDAPLSAHAEVMPGQAARKQRFPPAATEPAPAWSAAARARRPRP